MRYTYLALLALLAVCTPVQAQSWQPGPYDKAELERFQSVQSLQPYVYLACIDNPTHVYDGDTVQNVRLDLGFDITYVLDSVRLAGIDTPEMRGRERAQGIVQRDWLRQRLMENEGCFMLRSYKVDKGRYGRYLAELFVDGVNINKQMVIEGRADLNFYDK